MKFQGSAQITKRVISWSVFACLAGCLSPIEFPARIIANTLVISGQVSTLIDRNYVQIGRTADTERLPYPMRYADVKVIDDSGNVYPYFEEADKPGRYTSIDFNGISGRTYYLRVILPDGQIYESMPEKLPEETAENTVDYRFAREEYIDSEGTPSLQNFIKIYTTATLPNSSGMLYLRWNVEEVFMVSPTDFPDIAGYVPPPCFITQNADPQRVVVFSTENLNLTTVPDILVMSRLIDITFHEKHYFTTYQSSLTKGAYEYWRKVNILANQVGSIFDTPPSSIKGNIFNVANPTEKIVGYFQAVNQTSKRFFLHKTDLPFPLLMRDCLYRPERENSDYPYGCLDCLVLRNSSLKRPSWF